jgi:hypothetical protein
VKVVLLAMEIPPSSIYTCYCLGYGVIEEFECRII